MPSNVSIDSSQRSGDTFSERESATATGHLVASGRSFLSFFFSVRHPGGRSNEEEGQRLLFLRDSRSRRDPARRWPRFPRAHFLLGLGKTGRSRAARGARRKSEREKKINNLPAATSSSSSPVRRCALVSFFPLRRAFSRNDE